jgi:hypothetical protein
MEPAHAVLFANHLYRAQLLAFWGRRIALSVRKNDRFSGPFVRLRFLFENAPFSV